MAAIMHSKALVSAAEPGRKPIKKSKIVPYGLIICSKLAWD